MELRRNFRELRLVKRMNQSKRDELGSFFIFEARVLTFERHCLVATFVDCGKEAKLNASDNKYTWGLFSSISHDM